MSFLIFLVLYQESVSRLDAKMFCRGCWFIFLINHHKWNLLPRQNPGGYENPLEIIYLCLTGKWSTWKAIEANPVAQKLMWVLASKSSIAFVGRGSGGRGSIRSVVCFLRLLLWTAGTVLLIVFLSRWWFKGVSALQHRESTSPPATGLGISFLVIEAS